MTGNIRALGFLSYHAMWRPPATTVLSNAIGKTHTGLTKDFKDKAPRSLVSVLLFKVAEAARWRGPGRMQVNHHFRSLSFRVCMKR